MGVMLKRGVELNTEAAAITHILRRWVPLDVLITITAGSDGQHMIGSRHYSDEAVDVRTAGLLSQQSRESFAKMLEDALNAAPAPPVPFRALVESDHIHVQVARGYHWRDDAPQDSGGV